MSSIEFYNALLAAGLPVISATDEPNKPKQATFSRALTEVESEIYHDLRDPNRITIRNDGIQAFDQLKTEYQTAIDRLIQIETAPNPTNAQVVQAVRDLAKFMRLLLKFIAKRLVGI